MAKGLVFEYIVVHHPTPTKDSGGNDTTPPSKIIVPHAVALFTSEKEANIKVSRMIPSEYDDKLHECDVMIRPF